MSLKCSLLGHRFGETTVERDREEDGTEVVITITELETCTRCGETRVVSENKEVTTLETPDAADAADPAVESPGDAAGDDGGTNHVELDADAGADDAEILEDDGAESAAQAEARTSETAIPDAESGTEAPADGDAVIIDDAADGDEDDGDADRESPGAWPDEPDAVDPRDGDDDADWPDDGVEPTIGEDRRATVQESGTTEDRPAGDWPEETTRPDTGGAVGVDLEADGADVTVPEGMFVCSECGFTTEIESSSLRAGDFCPECRRGTLLQDGDADEE